MKPFSPRVSSPPSSSFWRCICEVRAWIASSSWPAAVPWLLGSVGVDGERCGGGALGGAVMGVAPGANPPGGWKLGGAPGGVNAGGGAPM